MWFYSFIITCLFAKRNKQNMVAFYNIFLLLRKGTIQYNTGIEKKKEKLKKFTKKAQNCCKYTLKKIRNAYIMIANEKTKERRKQTWQQEKKIYGF